MAKTKAYEEVIANMLQKLDREQAEYQATYTKYYGHEDVDAKHTYMMLIELCKEIRKEIALRERK